MEVSGADPGIEPQRPDDDGNNLNGNGMRVPEAATNVVVTATASGETENTETPQTSVDRAFTIVEYRGAGDRTRQKAVNKPTQLVASAAQINTQYWWLNLGWLVIFMTFIPAALAVIWFGVIPIGRTNASKFKDKAVWAFVINPGTYVFFSFMLTNVFLACLDQRCPWRPFTSYAPILLVNYIFQVGVIGTSVFLHGTFPGLGLVAIMISILTTLLGLRVLPHSLFDMNKERYDRIYHQFVKIMVTFTCFWIVLLAYIIANGQIDSDLQGLLTVLLSFITFIFKKVLLSMTDTYPIEIGMVISGLWLEHAVDVFISLAYPTATEVGVTFGIIWLTRVAEDVSFLAFQLDIWFRFRVWIKGVLTGKKGKGVEEDLNDDDRGHSNQHPGYRRRQMRFLVWKVASRVSSMLFYVAVIPILRFGTNKKFYPYTDADIKRVNTLSSDIYDNLFSHSDFVASIIFAVVSLGTFFVPWGIIYLWMKRFHKDVLEYILVVHRKAFVSEAYFGFVLAVLISNVLLGVSSVQVYNRVYFI